MLPFWLGVAALHVQAAMGQGAGKPFWRPDLASAGPMVMLVSLDEQRIYVYRNGVAIGESRISSGRQGHETPTGVYTILQKEREHHSNLYDNAPMPFMQRLSWDGLALHAGVLPGHPASHGCIRLPPTFAEQLFEVSPRGTVVVVTDQRVAPPEVNHPAAIAPLGLGSTHVDLASGESGSWPVDDGGPLSVVASTHDRALYVLQSGRLIASTPMIVPDGFAVGGLLLYVRRAEPFAVEQDGGCGRLTACWARGPRRRHVSWPRSSRCPTPLAPSCASVSPPGRPCWLPTCPPGAAGRLLMAPCLRPRSQPHDSGLLRTYPPSSRPPRPVSPLATAYV